MATNSLQVEANQEVCAGALGQMDPEFWHKMWEQQYERRKLEKKMSEAYKHRAEVEMKKRKKYQDILWSVLMGLACGTCLYAWLVILC